MSSGRSNVPRFYRICFTTIDPAVWLLGAWMNIARPSKILDAIVPVSTSSFNPLQSFLLQQAAGAHVFAAVTEGVLLRKTNDVRVWQAQQAGLLCWNIIGITSIVLAWRQQGRLSWEGLRSEDLWNFGIVAVFASVRMLFCAGVGVKSASGDGWKRK